jgi:hypothetical protein
VARFQANRSFETLQADETPAGAGNSFVVRATAASSRPGRRTSARRHRAWRPRAGCRRWDSGREHVSRSGSSLISYRRDFGWRRELGNACWTRAVLTHDAVRSFARARDLEKSASGARSAGRCERGLSMRSRWLGSRSVVESEGVRGLVIRLSRCSEPVCARAACWALGANERARDPDLAPRARGLAAVGS